MKIEYKYKGDEEKESMVGMTVGNCYISHRKPEHYFRMYRGFGISNNIIERLNSEGITRVLIIYQGVQGTRFLISPLKQWLESKKSYRNKDDDLQVFVSEEDMTNYNTIEEVPEE